MIAASNPLLNLRELALQALCEADAGTKVQLVLEMQQITTLPRSIPKVSVGKLPGKPTRPELAHPAKVPRRSPTTLEGRAATVHAIAHIEFNAIKNASHSTEFHIMKTFVSGCFAAKSRPPQRSAFGASNT